LRKKHADEMEAMRTRHRVEMRQMRDLNEGLQRMIAQNSQSTAHLISDSPVTQPRDDDDAD
jgi:cell division protein FtsB